MTRNSSGIAALICAIALFPGLGAAANEPAQDRLDRPSTPSPLAARTQLTAIGPLGPQPDSGLVAVGWRGHILTSQDDGSTWRQAQAPVDEELTAVHFPSAARGWVVGHGGVILATTDGGKTWLKQQDGRSTAQLMAAYYEARKASMPRAAQLLEDVRLNYGNGPEQPWLDVWFADEQRGYVVGAFNLIMATEDAGKTWVPWMEHVTNPRSLHLNALSRVGEDLFIASEQGIVFRFERSTLRFEPLETGYKGVFFGVVGNAGVVVAYGLSGNAYRSTDRGATWQKVETGTRASITGGTLTREGEFVLVTAAGEVLRGDPTARQFAPVPSERRGPLAGVVAIKGDRVITVGWRGAAIQPLPATARP